VGIWYKFDGNGTIASDQAVRQRTPWKKCLGILDMVGHYVFKPC